jgi:hypothetical protein
MFGLYGIIRAFNGSYEPPHDALGNRLILSLSNGVF